MSYAWSTYPGKEEKQVVITDKNGKDLRVVNTKKIGFGPPKK